MIKPILLSSCAAVLCLATALSCHAETPAALLKASYLASGGKAWDHISSLHYVAARRGGGDPGSTEHWEDVRTGRFITYTHLPPRDFIDAFDGVSHWTKGTSGIAYTLGDVDSRLTAADEAFRVTRAYWYRERFSGTIAAAGTVVKNGRRFDRLEITPEGGRPFKLWLDYRTHLISRVIEQQAETLVVTAFSDYRRVDGVLLPFRIRRGDGQDAGDDAVETVSKIEVNADPPQDVFDIPPAEPSDAIFPAGVSSVSLPFRLDNNVILVPVSINGQPPIDALFDSGGSLILQPDTVKALDLASGGPSRETGGGEGSVAATKGRVGTLSIGGVTLISQTFSSFPFWPDHPTVAIFGQEALQRLVIRIDFDTDTLTLTRPDAFSYAGQGRVLPFHFQDNQPEVSGAVDGIAGLFAIDTGDDGDLLLIAPFARRYGMAEKYHAKLPYGGQAVTATHGLWARVGQVTLDGADGRPVVMVSKPITRISTQISGFDANRNVSGNIGLGILKQFNVTFDYPHQRIILDPNRFYGTVEAFHPAGFDLDAKGVVTAVYEGSDAAAAGMKIGQTVTSIDGVALTNMSPSDIRAKLTGESNSRVSVVVNVGASARTLSLTLRDLL